jgi:plastocyanin
MSVPRLRPLAAALACALLAMLLLDAAAADARVLQKRTIVTRPDGTQRLTFRFGPLAIRPGQNDIALAVNRLKPPTDGWITSFKPNLVRNDGSVPAVDVIHLHHAVWIVDGRLTWAAGEEKTVFRMPKGFGWRYRKGQRWVLNHMIHNLTPDPDKVWVTWTMDFVPAKNRKARGMREVRTQWLDVEGGKAYPVFDVLRGSGGNGRFTYPDEAVNPYGAGLRRNQWVVDRDATLVGTAGHLHPGGLWTDLKLTRNGRTVRLFRSRAKYFEPAGPVSWDVSMTATPRRWRVAVRKGDVLSVNATYDSRRASWYESMGIMPVAMTLRRAGGVNPFHRRVDVRGVLTHGHLPENDNHGGTPTQALRDARRLRDGAQVDVVDISDFVYRQGDLSEHSVAGRPPIVTEGTPLTFRNLDAQRNIFHTITACRAPCTALTGIAYPLADGPVTFDSAELGFGPAFFTAAANRDTWQTPATLRAGTYTYFCRIHPFMRGAFRVKQRA